VTLPVLDEVVSDWLTVQLARHGVAAAAH
jgi:hypothetical protein